MIKVPQNIVASVSTEFVKLSGRAGMSVKSVPTVKDVELILEALLSYLMANQIPADSVDFSSWVD